MKMMNDEKFIKNSKLTNKVIYYRFILRSLIIWRDFCGLPGSEQQSRKRRMCHDRL